MCLHLPLCIQQQNTTPLPRQFPSRTHTHTHTQSTHAHKDMHTLSPDVFTSATNTCVKTHSPFYSVHRQQENKTELNFEIFDTYGISWTWMVRTAQGLDAFLSLLPKDPTSLLVRTHVTCDAAREYAVSSSVSLRHFVSSDSHNFTMDATEAVADHSWGQFQVLRCWGPRGVLTA